MPARERAADAMSARGERDERSRELDANDVRCGVLAGARSTEPARGNVRRTMFDETFPRERSLAPMLGRYPACGWDRGRTRVLAIGRDGILPRALRRRACEQSSSWFPV